jgi:signal transduction histidine kinase
VEAIEDGGTVKFTIIPAKRLLVITDTGKGINSAEHANLFSPFFSTKKDGQGIGLTLVREILLNHGFEFSLKTVADKQTEFRIQYS